MKIVIDIDEDYYELIKQTVKADHYYFKPFNIIADGTPLPKGHGRLIEITPQLEQVLFSFTRYTGIDECPYENATDVIDSIPTIIEADLGEQNEM